MGINTQKVVAGGLAAGVVLNVIDYLVNAVILADAMKTDANNFQPGLGDSMAQMAGGTIAGHVLMDFVVGCLLVWTYAAMRPRFGPGAKTAIYVALLFFCFGMILSSGYMEIGMMAPKTWWTYALIWLVNLVLASWVGGRLYTEDGSPATA